jgi:glutamate synthase domain-containing protein 3
MSGGIAYVLDEEERFEKLYNPDLVDLEAVESEENVSHLKRLIEQHLHWTGSTAAKRVLENWEEMLPKFVKVMPKDLKRVLKERQEAELEVVT